MSYVVVDELLVGVIQTQDKEDANYLADAVWQGGTNTFAIPLSASGNLPATHWLGNGPMNFDFTKRVRLKEVRFRQNGTPRWETEDTHPEESDEMRGLALGREKPFRLSNGDITDLMTRSVFTLMDPYEVLALMDLRIIHGQA